MEYVNQMPIKKRFRGFTLAELLISLLILAEIATFTIPKVLYTQQNTSYRAAAKEVAGMISDAYLRYRTSNTVTATTSLTDLVPYLNYTKRDTATLIDDQNTGGTWDCSSFPCYRLHNGGMIMSWGNFGATTSDRSIPIFFDPDGRVTDGTTNGPGKSIEFLLFTDGRLQTGGTVSVNNFYIGGSGPFGSFTNAGFDPSWFSW
jgi:prepilin-type N-terminal cleavage/methylation domain-containing protein